MPLLLDRHWFLTSTTYGTWLPGDRRGFVGPVESESGGYEIHNTYGAPYDNDMPSLRAWSEQQMTGQPIYLLHEHASQALDQFQETARHRGWSLLVASVMNNHFHVLLSVAGDPSPDTLLRDIKSYASRRLNRQWGKPKSGTWWTASGSKRPKKTEREVRSTASYAWNQDNWLVRFAHPEIPPEWLVSRKR